MVHAPAMPSAPAAPGRLEPAPLVRRVLSLARSHLAVDVALLAAFTETGEMVGVVQGDGEAALRPEAELPVDARRCRMLLDGAVPPLVGDVSSQRPPTGLGPGVGAYVAAPIQLPAGTVFGLLCGLSYEPRPDFDVGARRVLSVLANLAGQAIAGEEPRAHRQVAAAEATLGAIGGSMRVVFQPVFRLRTGDAVGFEALARFPTDPARPTGSWFRRARQLGLGVDLELAALRRAVGSLDRIPEPLYLTVNMFSETLLSVDLAEIFAGLPRGRVVLELAEHERVAESLPLAERVEELRRLGARFAIDDVGSGFASMRHVLRIRPEILKLDMSLTHAVDHDAMHRMLVSSMASFAAESGMVPAAEGIESRPQLESLRRLGVAYGQGHYLGRPREEPKVAGAHADLPWETVADSLP
jgi:EAL domain-containing protein (putative c-di-GMP-specific phosphodiesterase class I)